MSRAAITAALEALEAGDKGLVEKILLDLLDEDGKAERGVRCELCGVRFDWPGELDNHVRVSHWQPA